MGKKLIEIMDTTLRDGEQTSGVSYTPNEKLTIAKFLINKLNIDRIEVASARVSDGELESVKKINNLYNLNESVGLELNKTTSSDNSKWKWTAASGIRIARLTAGWRSFHSDSSKARLTSSRG